ncbi:MAG: HEPN domain-containing protein [Candidatus Omnitrophota bacterium]
MKGNDYIKEKTKEWFKKGDSDIKTAEILIRDADPPTDTTCFHCQQAVEKYLKGYLTIEGIEFLKSHDLDYLLKLCKGGDNEFEAQREAVLTLNKYGIEPRYPADIPVHYSFEETKRAIGLAKEMVKFVRKKYIMKIHHEGKKV